MSPLYLSKQSFVAILLTVLLGVALGQNTTTTTTSKPDTTTTSPNTTTTTTTPVPITTTTVTPSPTTSTTPPPPTPTPTPNLIAGNVTTNNHTCIRYEFSSVNLLIKYPKVDNSTGVANISILNTPPSFPTNTCSLSIQSFTLSHGDKTNNQLYELTFGFTSNSNSVVLDFLEATVTYNQAQFPNVTNNLIGTNFTTRLNGTTPNFNVEKTHSYSCGHVTVPKTQADPFHVAFTGLRIQAFMEKTKNGQFSTEHNCQSEINDVVPIAVGIALTGLVIIVMVAYFIGRRHSRRLTYQSV